MFMLLISFLFDIFLCSHMFSSRYTHGGPSRPREIENPAPVVISASQEWDGNDGPWSSFPIQVGTPPQNVRVMVGTSAYQTLVVLPQGCIVSDSANCVELRGREFILNQSSTWVKNQANPSSDIYALAIEERLGFTGRGLYGFDDITLGWQGSRGPKLENQTVGGMAGQDFFLGIFGLNPRPINFTTFNNPIPSYIESLRVRNLIPSTSWSYTAGNRYRLNKVLGSLTLGGYDTSKFIANNLTWSFNSEDARDITVNIRSITKVDSPPTMRTPLLPNPITAFMDSSIPQIWLPEEACAIFEEVFGLIWNETLALYFVNDTQHAENAAKNSSVIFQLSNTTSTHSVNIELPYAAFDLRLSAPLVSSPTRYFPLKRAANESQYTLGRTFFQEAYLTADYDRRNFSVSQCAWDGDAQQDIVAIISPSDSVIADPEIEAPGPKLPPSVIAGIVAGTIVIVTIIILIVYHAERRRRQHKAPPKSQQIITYDGKPEMTGEGLSHNTTAAKPGPSDLQGNEEGPLHELNGSDGLQIFEMPAREEVAFEMGESTGKIASK